MQRKYTTKHNLKILVFIMTKHINWCTCVFAYECVYMYEHAYVSVCNLN